MQIRITKPGLLSTLQDTGRWQYLSQAVPVSGAMDTLSARVANIGVGNKPDAAVVEFTYAAAEFIAETNILIAYAGAGAILKANDQILPTERPIYIPAGTVVQLVNNPLGSRTYVAIAGGWDVPLVLGSRSTYITAGFGGLHGRALQAGDVLNSIQQLSNTSTSIINGMNSGLLNYPNWGLASHLLLPANKKTIRVIPAKEFNWFEALSILDFLSTPYKLSLRSNRMGYHLGGAIIKRKVNQELLSTSVTPGTIQVTGNGSLVLLMADCQTTGGYPRIAQVAAVDLPLCGQLKPGDTIYFKEISREEAEMLYLEREEHMHKLTLAVKHKFL
jgi:antagonist of KipI